MPREEGLPPPVRGSRTSPDMAQDKGTMGKLDQLAGMEGQGMGGGGEEEAAQMVMEGTQMLLQAAQMNPDLQPMVMEAVQSLKRGMERIIGPAGGGEEMGGQQPQKKRQKPPKSPPVEEDELSGGYGI